MSLVIFKYEATVTLNIFSETKRQFTHTTVSACTCTGLQHDGEEWGGINVEFRDYLIFYVLLLIIKQQECIAQQCSY